MLQLERLEARVVLSAASTSSSEPREWIVRFSEDGLQRHGTPDAALLDTAQVEFQLTESLGLPGQVLVHVTQGDASSAAAALASNPLLKYAVPNSRIEGLGQNFPNESLNPDFDNLFGLHNSTAVMGRDIDAPEAWELATGQRDIVVGVIDSGVDYTHPDLYRNIWINQGEIPPAKFDPLDPNNPARVQDVDGDGLVSFIDLNDPVNHAHLADANNDGRRDARDLLADPSWANGVNEDFNFLGIGGMFTILVDDLVGWDFANNDNDPFDDHGHGTHVAGIIGAEGDNGLGVVGVNWNVSILPLKFLDANNRGDTADALKAINYATQLHLRGNNVRVLNNSWESAEGLDAALLDSVQETARQDMLFIAGAGNGDVFRRPNNNDLNPVYPASFDVDNVISVTAVDAEDELVSFYNFGPNSVDLAAPGLTIYSTATGGGYDFQSGTSFSTAFVSGVAALALSQLPDDVTAQELRATLLDSADVLPSLQGKIAGAGRLNALGALTTDRYQPRAVLVNADEVKVDQRNVAALEFEVFYDDNRDVLAASLGAGDIVLQPRAGGAALPVELAAPVVGGDNDAILVKYRVLAPGGAWDISHNGEWDLLLQPGQVLDTATPGNQARPLFLEPEHPTRLGTAVIDVPAFGTLKVTDIEDGVDANLGDGEALDAFGRRTLRAAIMEANASPGENTIVLEQGFYVLTLPGANEDAAVAGDLDITDTTGKLTILGAGAENTFIDAFSLDRVFEIHPGVTVEIRGVTLEGGESFQGGGLRNRGDLTLRDSVVRRSIATFGGGIHHETGILLVENSKVSENFSYDEGGGASIVSGLATFQKSFITDNSAQRYGGGVMNDGELRLLETTVQGNAAAQGGSAGGGGGVGAAGKLTVENSFILDNVAGGEAIPHDAFEPNDEDTSPAELYGEDRMLRGLTLHHSLDRDFYRWTASATGNVTIDLLFSHDQGDLALEVFDTNGDWQAGADSADDNEQLVYPVVAGQTILIHVVASVETTQPKYDLNIDGPNRSPALSADRFEPNNTRLTAANLYGGDQTLTNLSIHTANNNDYYRWTANESGLFSATMRFTHIVGDLDLYLYDHNGALLEFSESTTDEELIEWDVIRGRDYYLRVVGYAGATSPSYELELDGPEGFSDGGGVYIVSSLAGADTVAEIRDSVISGNLAEVGGGIYNEDGGKLTVERTTISNNQAISRTASTTDFLSYTAGGGVFTADKTIFREVSILENEAAVGAGIDISPYITEPVEIYLSLIANNTAKQLDYSAGGGIRNGNGGEGGGVLKVYDTTIRDNFSRFEGGGVTNGGNMLLERVTISGNTASAGGGVSNWATLTVESSTISGNHATGSLDSVVFGLPIYVPKGEGGGLYNIYLPGISLQDAVATLRNTTITNNTADVFAGGVVADSSEVFAENSIIAGNPLTGGTAEDIISRDRFLLIFDYPGAFTSQDYNVLGPFPVDSTVTTQANDRLNILDPMLGPLQDNGGPTHTHLPLPGSVAIDNGRLAGNVTADQRGVARPTDGNANGTVAPDIGAVERYHGEIRGVLFHDFNRNQTRDIGEPGLNKWTVFLDTNNNGRWDEGERTVKSGADGSYTFPLVEPGDYHVGVLLQELFEQTFPTSVAAEIEPNNTLATAQNLDHEVWSLGFDANVGSATENTSTTIPHLTVQAAGDGSVDYYSFTVEAGARAIFDIDYGDEPSDSFDSYLRLYKANGDFLQGNDDTTDSTLGALGSTSVRDSFFEHTFTEAGTYILKVSAFSDVAVPAGRDYQVQISLEGKPVYVVQQPSGHSTMAAALDLERYVWGTSFHADIGDEQQNTSQTLPHLSVETAGRNADDYYRFRVNEADLRGVFDIDRGIDGAGPFDSTLALFDAQGQLLASNDNFDASAGAGGSAGDADAYLEHVFTTPGDYFLKVSSAGGNIPLGADYVLHISLERHARGVFTRPATVLGGEDVATVDFANVSDIGAIRGEVFNDQNADGVRGDKEAALADWQIFLDTNANGVLDDGETVQTTNAQGRYAFEDLPPGPYTVEQVLKTGWTRTAPVQREVLNVDFSDADGAASWEGFFQGGSLTDWRLTTDRGNDAGHSADDSVYFGSDEGPCGCGSYLANASGVLISPVIDLTHVSGKILLHFNHLLDVADMDHVRVAIHTSDGAVTLADNQLVGGLSNTARAFAPVTLDLSEYAGQEIEVEFIVLANTVVDRSERISASVVEGQTYYVQIVGNQGSTLDDYSLNIELPAVGEDVFEPNDGFPSAIDFGSIDLLSLSNLSIHDGGGNDNEDYYRFIPIETGVIDIRVLFEHALGDIDVFLYNAAQQQVASAISSNDNEVIRATVTAGQTYYLRVDGYNRAINPRYDIEIDAPGILPDSYEPNDSKFTPIVLGEITDFQDNLLNLHAGFDEDFFSFSPEQDGLIRIDLNFLHSAGDLDLRLLDEFGDDLAVSEGTEDQETIEFFGLASATYLVQVFGFGGDVNSKYELKIDTPGAAPDIYGTSNDDFSSAHDLGTAGLYRLSNLTIDSTLDQDFFRFTATGTGVATLELLFEQFRGDADLFLYDENQNLIASTVREGWYVDDIRVESPGIHQFDVERGDVFSNVRFGNQSTLGAGGVGQNARVEGRVMSDPNRNRHIDPGEVGVPGVLLWLDYDGDGQIDANETTTTLEDDPQTPEDELGVYRFLGLAPGNYVVRMLPGADAQQTFPIDNQFTSHESRTGNNPQSVVVGDFDGVGSLDVAVANSGGATVSVLLSNVNGVFPDQGASYLVAPALSNPTPMFITAADVDQQLGADLLVANFRAESISLLKNLGGGAFADFVILLDLKTVPEATGLRNFKPISLAVGDFNQDTYPDVAVAMRAPKLSDPGRLAILLNDGTGAFTLAESHVLGVTPEAVVVAQLNDDNNDNLINALDKPDLAIAAYGDPTSGALGQLTTLLGSHGPSLFMAGSSLALPTGSFALAAGDLDGVRGDDLAVANSLTRSVSIFTNDGAGVLTAQPVALAVGVVTSIAALDIDGDGDNDLTAANALVAATGPTVKLFRNRGAAMFPQEADQTIGVASLQGSNYFSLGAADFNGDKTLDLVVAKANTNVVRVLTGEIVPIGYTVTVAANQTAGSNNFSLAFQNNEPTLNQPPDLNNLLEDAGVQTVNLSGISAGDEENQQLTVTATTNNPALLVDLSVEYTSPAATAVLRFRPADNQSGNGAVTVTVRDAGPDGVPGNADDATFSRTLNVVVQAVNDPPTLGVINNPAPLPEDAATQTINLTGVSAGAGESQMLRITAMSDNAALLPHPAVSYTSGAANGSLMFAPVGNQSGSATVTVTVWDAGLNGVEGDQDDASFSRTFTVTVQAVNDPPTLSPIADPAALPEDAPLQTLNFSGVSAGGGESQALRVSAVSTNPALLPDPTVSYTADSAAGSLSFQPVANESGTAIVVVTVFDAGLDGTPNTADDGEFFQTFTVTVQAVNDPPELNAIPNPAPLLEEAPTQTINFTGVSAGPRESQALRVSAVSGNPALIPTPTVVYTSPGSMGTLTFRPVADQSGVAVITVRVTDAGLDGIEGNGDDALAEQTFTVTVQAVNDPPTLAPIADPAPLPEDAPLQTIDLTGISAGGGESQTLRVSAVSSNTALIPHPAVNYVSGLMGTLSFQPISDRSGAATITVTVADAGLDGVPGNADDLSVEQTFNVVVQAENDRPTIDPIAGRLRLPEDAPLQMLELTGISAGPGQSQAVRVTATSSNPALIPQPLVNYTSPNAAGSLTFQPVADQSGMATLTITVTNAGLDEVLGTADDGAFSVVVQVIVDAVNDPPQLNDIPDPGAINEDALQQTVMLSGIAAGGGESQLLRISATSDNPALVPSPSVVYASPETTAVLTYKPAPDQNGSVVITVTLEDAGQDGVFGTGDDAQTVRTFSVTVTPVNDPPVLDLNGDDAPGLDWTVQLSAGTDLAALVDLAAAGPFTLHDVDSSTLSGLTATLTPLLDGAAETLQAQTAGTSITANYNPATGVLTLAGVDTLAHYVQVLATLAYRNTAALPHTMARTVVIRAHDGIEESAPATATVQIQSTRDRHDVNGDGKVDTFDLLLWVQNARERGFPKPMSEINIPGPPYLDVNNDALFSISDLLDVVRVLRDKAAANGEGEAAGVDSQASVTARENDFWWTSERRQSSLPAEADRNKRILLAPTSETLSMAPERPWRRAVVLRQDERTLAGERDSAEWPELDSALDLLAPDIAQRRERA
jgi:subtilisin family serine protease